ncbi:hypothetical protein L198_03175 [Cryptococcus wingfieldii CBS 7118]|uniref:Uncharacterized protein n=1 Tax=Cryptococcus wingfieldii CBS 7118 TaxID=1295528 RepID=A0A1E3JJ13_9TREE|nr:hypothetical protein L198_03175 [Cryptococcus wingfieldii CBS 7118]ODO00848.1 hypothetical protein L198_03175 [Cryptococcus wingfieldii CBS 7118]
MTSLGVKRDPLSGKAIEEVNNPGGGVGHGTWDVGKGDVFIWALRGILWDLGEGDRTKLVYRCTTWSFLCSKPKANCVTSLALSFPLVITLPLFSFRSTCLTIQRPTRFANEESQTGGDYSLNINTVSTLSRMLDRENLWVQAFLGTRACLAECDTTPSFLIKAVEPIVRDVRRYNRPRASEIGVIIPAGQGSVDKRNIITQGVTG